MPFQDNTFDFTFCQAAFKNFSDPVRAIAEMHRVLRPGGLSVISDLRRDASAAEIEREIKGMGIGPLNRFLVRWTFRNMLLKSAYTVNEMQSMVAETPFGHCKITVDGLGTRWSKLTLVVTIADRAGVAVPYSYGATVSRGTIAD